MKPLPLLRSNTFSKWASKQQQQQQQLLQQQQKQKKYEPGGEDEGAGGSRRNSSERKQEEMVKLGGSQPTQQLGRAEQETSSEGRISSEILPARRPANRAASPVHKIAREEAMNEIGRADAFTVRQVGRLDEAYGKVLDKLHELEVTASRFSKLQQMAGQLLGDFETNGSKFGADIKSQINSLESFKSKIGAIKYLQKRLEAQRQMTEVYKDRLGRVQEKIKKQKQMEVIWRQRASRRLRVLWGVITVLIVIWLLFTFTKGITLTGFEEEDHEKDLDKVKYITNDEQPAP